MKSIKKEEENISKYDLFLKDIKEENNFSKKIEVLFDIQFLELFSKILNMPRLDFTNKITSNITYILAGEYDQKIAENKDYIKILYKCVQKYNRKYNEIILPLIEAYELHEMNIEIKNEESDYITNFRKHCSKTGKYAVHKCHKDYEEFGKFIPITINRKIKYVVCDLCRKVYVVTRFKNYCEECRQVYYCNLLSKDENPDLLPATWNPPHCENIFNKAMNCNKCKEIFYLNLKTNKLECINKKCNNIIDPSKAQWKCPTCNDLFKSGAKVFNPSEIEQCKYLIKKALILKQKAHPYRIPCCKDLIDFNNTEFYHGKNCSGTLYFVENDEKVIVVCQKCRAINWFGNFIWTCPKCKTRFRDTNSDRNEEILKKSRCFDIQKLNKETNYEEKTFRRKTKLINTEKYNNYNSNYNDYSTKTLNLAKYDMYSGKYNTTNDYTNNSKYDVDTFKSFRSNYINTNNNNIVNENKEPLTKVKSRGKYIFDRTIGKQLRYQNPEFLTLRVKDEKDEIKNLKDSLAVKENKNQKKYFYKNKYEELRKNKMDQDKNNTESTKNTKNNENNNENANKQKNIDTNKKKIILLKNHLRSKQKIKGEPNSQKPEDIINSSMVNTKLDIPIENESIKNNSLLYENIQRRLKKILSKGKLPVFNIDNYTVGNQIGDGSFGTIYEVTNNKTKIKYALKKIVTSDINNLEKYQKEFEIVHQCTHPFILDIHGICFRCFDPTTFIIYVLMDLAESDWEEEIFNRKKNNYNFYTENQLISILKQLSSALYFLQKEKSISHRDIKPENILVFKKDIYKLSDFGEADNEAKMDDRQKTLRGTELYMSPILHEGLLHEVDYIIHNTFKSDVFSLGCCLIIAGCLDFEAIKEIRKLKKVFLIKNYLVKKFQRKYSDKFIDLLVKMINFNENDRLDFIQLEKIINESF